jgi:DNA-binding response OmpR family regulator
VTRILVIDDQSDVRAVISTVLRVKGFEVIGAGSAAAGLAAFASSKFDMAIVDVFLPDSNGTDVIRALREHTPDLPIVVISGVTALDFLSVSPEFGNIVCLQKPFRPLDLMQAIKAAMAPFRPFTAGELEMAQRPAV